MLAFIILALINIMILLQTKKTSSGGGKGWTVYGTMGCGWTRKQLEYMKKMVSHTPLWIVTKVDVMAWMPSLP